MSVVVIKVPMKWIKVFDVVYKVNYYLKYPYRNILFTKPNKISKLVVNFTDISIA